MSAAPPPPWFLPTFVVAFPLLWVGVAALLRQRAGFTWATARQYTHPERVNQGVRWVSAQIGGIAFKGCLHVSRVPGGYLVLISSLFLGGGRYISDADIAALVPSESWLLGLVLTGDLANGDTFRTWGRFARYILTQRASPASSDGDQVR